MQHVHIITMYVNPSRFTEHADMHYFQFYKMATLRCQVVLYMDGVYSFFSEYSVILVTTIMHLTRVLSPYF